MMPALEKDSRRVKLYILDNGEWLDQGTGTVGLIRRQEPGRTDSIFIVVVLEGTTEILLDTRAQKHSNFELQDETLLLWQDLESGKDFALSFQEKEDCVEIFNSLSSFFEQNPDSVTFGTTTSPDTSLLQVKTVASLHQKYQKAPISEPTIANLEDLAHHLDYLLNHAPMWSKTRILEEISSPEWFGKLVDLIEPLSDLLDENSTEDDMVDIRLLATTLQNVLFLNDARIWNMAVSPLYARNVLHILEYLEEWFRSKPDFKSMASVPPRVRALPFAGDEPPNPQLVQLIYSTNILSLFKDVIFAKTIDDSNHSTLNISVMANQVDIVRLIIEDSEYLERLFHNFSNIMDDLRYPLQYPTENVPGTIQPSAISKRPGSPKTGVNKLSQTVMFLNELCNTAKSLPMSERNKFYKTLIQHGLFDVFDFTLSGGDLMPEPDITCRLQGASLLLHVLDQDSSLLRSFMKAQANDDTIPDDSLLRLLISRIHNEKDVGIQSQLSEAFKILLDGNKSELPLGMGEAAALRGPIRNQERDSNTEEFLTMFYETYADFWADAILKMIDVNHVKSLSEYQSTVVTNFCEMLCFMIKEHGYRSKTWLLQNHVTEKVILLLQARQQHVRLASLRFLRTCIGMNDDFYNRHLIKNHVFKPFMELFLSNYQKFNLINSACLDLIHYIVDNNLRSLVEELVNHHTKPFLEKMDTTTIKDLLLLHDRINDPNANDETDIFDDTPDSPDIHKVMASGARRPNDFSGLFGLHRKKPRRSPSSRGGVWGRSDRQEEAYFEDDDVDASPLTSDNDLEDSRPTTGGKTVPDFVSSEDFPPLKSVKDEEEEDVLSLKLKKSDQDEDEQGTTVRKPIFKNNAIRIKLKTSLDLQPSKRELDDLDQSPAKKMKS